MKKLKYLMAIKEISQKELADAIGVSQPAVSAYISGISNPRMSTLLKIADALGVGIEEIQGDTYENEANEPTEIYQRRRPLIDSSELERELLDMARSILQLREEVVDLRKEMADSRAAYEDKLANSN